MQTETRLIDTVKNTYWMAPSFSNSTKTRTTTQSADSSVFIRWLGDSQRLCQVLTKITINIKPFPHSPVETTNQSKIDEFNYSTIIKNFELWLLDNEDMFMYKLQILKFILIIPNSLVDALFPIPSCLCQLISDHFFHLHLHLQMNKFPVSIDPLFVFTRCVLESQTEWMNEWLGDSMIRWRKKNIYRSIIQFIPFDRRITISIWRQHCAIMHMSFVWPMFVRAKCIPIKRFEINAHNIDSFIYVYVSHIWLNARVHFHCWFRNSCVLALLLIYGPNSNALYHLR